MKSTVHYTNIHKTYLMLHAYTNMTYQCSSLVVCSLSVLLDGLCFQWRWNCQSMLPHHRTSGSPQGLRLEMDKRSVHVQSPKYRDAGKVFKSTVPMLESWPNMRDDIRFPHTAEDWKMKKKMPKYWFMRSWPFLLAFWLCLFPLIVR